MNTNHSLFSLIANASGVVQLVMLILLITSITSWAIIFKKFLRFKTLRQSLALFQSQFWVGIDFVTFHNWLTEKNMSDGLAPVFEAGYKEYQRLATTALSRHEKIQNISRALRIASSKEIAELEKQLPFLATVGSVSPYVGLFGTVFGIMGAFSALGAVEQATIAMVAPGISEALIATAMGLFCAIPAVIAYNRYRTALDDMISAFDNFEEEFIRALSSKE
jgi:biopolymer transport protein TolQ